MKTITKTEAKIAKKLVERYNTQVHTQFKRIYTCICCKDKKIDPIDNQADLLSPDQQNWYGGAVFMVDFGYGSDHDLSSFLMGVCDSCVNDLIKEKFIVNAEKLENDLKKLLV